MDQKYTDDEIDFRRVFKVLLARKKHIAAGVFVCTFLAVAVSFLLPKVYENISYLSVSNIGAKRYIDAQGNKQLPGMDIATFKKLTIVYKNNYLFNAFKSGEGDQFRDREIPVDFFDKNVIPVYSYDAVSQLKDDENPVISIMIKDRGNSPKEATERVRITGEYIKTILLNSQLWSYYNVQKSRLSEEITQSRGKIIQHEFESNMLNKKAALIESKFLTMPSKSEVFERQILQVTKETEKYLSPQQQYVSIKITLANIEYEIEVLNRKIKTNQILLAYIDKIFANYLINKDYLIDKALLDNIDKEKSNYFKESNPDLEEAFYLIDEKHQELFGLKNSKYTLYSDADMNKDPISPKKKIIVGATLVLSFFVFVIHSLLITWWRSLKDDL